MKKEQRIRQYLGHFLEKAVWGAIEAFPEMIDVKLLHIFPKNREIWCVFVYHPEIQELESRLNMWARFWHEFCGKRKAFYTDFKKLGLGYVTLYPLFISKDKLDVLIEESQASLKIHCVHAEMATNSSQNEIASQSSSVGL